MDSKDKIIQEQKERIIEKAGSRANGAERPESVDYKPGMHEHFAVIDKEIGWYGSVNLLSDAKEEDNLMRVKSKEIAQELQGVGFTVSDR